MAARQFTNSGLGIALIATTTGTRQGNNVMRANRASANGNEMSSTLVPIRVGSVAMGTSSTDTVTLKTAYSVAGTENFLDPRCVAIRFQFVSSTGTVAISTIAFDTTDTVLTSLPAITSGGILDTPIYPVNPDATIVYTSGTLATAATTIKIYQYGMRELLPYEVSLLPNPQ